MMVLSGVAHLNMRGGHDGFRRDTARLSLQPSLGYALNHALAQGGLQLPSNSNLSFRVLQWAPFASVSSFFDKDNAVNAGFAVDDWRLVPLTTVTEAGTGALVDKIFEGLDVDVGASDRDGILYRIGYSVTLVGTLVFSSNQVD